MWHFGGPLECHLLFEWPLTFNLKFTALDHKFKVDNKKLCLTNPVTVPFNFTLLFEPMKIIDYFKISMKFWLSGEKIIKECNNQFQICHLRNFDFIIMIRWDIPFECKASVNCRRVQISDRTINLPIPIPRHNFIPIFLRRQFPSS